MGAVTPTPGLGQIDPCSPFCCQHKAVSSQERLGGSLKTCLCLLPAGTVLALPHTPAPAPSADGAGSSQPHVPCPVPGGFPSTQALPCPHAASDPEGGKGRRSQQGPSCIPVSPGALGPDGAGNIPALFVLRLVNCAVQISVGFFEMKIKLIEVRQILCSGPCCWPKKCLFLGAAEPAPRVINTLCMPVSVGQSLLLMLNMSWPTKVDWISHSGLKDFLLRVYLII